MIASTTTSTGRRRAASFVAAHPFRTVVRLLPVGIAAMVAIDAMLGETAEYFNAWSLLSAWERALTGGAVSEGASFILNQDELSAPAALGLGSAILVVEPAIVLVAITWPISRLLRRGG